MPNNLPASQTDPVRVSASVWQFPVPTSTLPPAFVTNTYVIAANGDALIVDFGSAAPESMEACTHLLRRLRATRVIGIVATHYHRDHTEGMPQLSAHLDAPIYVHATDMESARRAMQLDDSRVVHTLPSQFLVGGQVGVAVHHEPGHTHGHVHVVIAAEGVILVGDHLAGDGSVWIGPPDGHIESYYEALAHIRDSGCTVAGPGHGPLLTDAHSAAVALLERRQVREQQIWTVLDNWHTREQVFDRVYGDTVTAGAAQVAKRTITAHLQHLLDTGRARRRYALGRGFEYLAVDPAGPAMDAATNPGRSSLRSP